MEFNNIDTNSKDVVAINLKALSIVSVLKFVEIDFKIKLPKKNYLEFSQVPPKDDFIYPFTSFIILE